MALLVGGPLHGEDRDLPDDLLFVTIPMDDGERTPYSRVHITDEGQQVEIWGWAPYCYRQVQAYYFDLKS